MSLHRYHTPQVGGGIYLMRGGSLTRYHTPVVTQRGAGLAENLLKVAGPSIVTAMQNTIRDVQQGKSLSASAKDSAKTLQKNLKRKAPSLVMTLGKHKAQQKYKKTKRAVKDIFSL